MKLNGFVSKAEFLISIKFPVMREFCRKINMHFSDLLKIKISNKGTRNNKCLLMIRFSSFIQKSVVIVLK